MTVRKSSGGAARSAPGYRLTRPPAPGPSVLRPDAGQARVLAHATGGSGPLLVLAGPGTGKTSTLVEAVARRVEAGLPPERALVLTFSRKAAQELRERITTRLGKAGTGPQAWTFHAFCYALLRASGEAGAEPLRLLSGPEQDVVLRELLHGSLELGRRWPAALRPALLTRGLAEQVRALLSRAREVGLDPDELAGLAAREGRADWSALASFFAEYLDVLDLQGAVDYAELVHRAVLLLEHPQTGPPIAARFGAVFVDEYQDTDPAQERLLQALAGGGRDLVAVGDPDQAIYAFRGAEVEGLLQFPERFRHADGRPAEVVALQTCRRSGAALLAASRQVAQGLPAPGLAAATLQGHRCLEPAHGLAPGVVEAHTYSSSGAQAEAVAELLRREHLDAGTPWARMAVLVRSASRSLPLLRRVLTASGVPLEVAGDELPLAREPALAPLLLALRVAADPSALTGETARTLLLSPLVGADPGQLRRLGRALRAVDREQAQRAAAAGEVPLRLPGPSEELVRQALCEPDLLLLLEDDVARPARRLVALLSVARQALAAGPEHALWQLWQGSPWPARLEQAALAGGAAGRAADRDLDAVVQLFALTARACERPGTQVQTLLDELELQQIPADPLAEAGVRGAGVRLLTAHRSKGLEWDVVVVADVQEGGWPDLRRRSSLLEVDRLGRDGPREPASRGQLLADERRLFYVACTRARRRLVVTAVAGLEADGERPSRFLQLLGVEVVAHLERTARPLSLPALVAALRRIAVDPDHTMAARRAATDQLAALAAAVDDHGLPLVPSAHPDSWWGLLETPRDALPLHDPALPVPLSGSSLSALVECPLRWFLDHEVNASPPTSAASGFGGVLHALADEVATGRSPADLDVLLQRLDTVWDQLAYDAPWQSRQQRTAAREALARFLTWHTAARDRTLVASELPFRVEVAVPGGQVVLRGSMDRVELDRDGRVHVVDLKTGKTAPSGAEVVGHPQLATYQLAVRSGALDGQLPAPPDLGGAELVLLRHDAGSREGGVGPKVPAQGPLEPSPSWVEELLGTAVQRVLGEHFPPTPGERCGQCAFRACCPAQPEGRQVVT